MMGFTRLSLLSLHYYFRHKFSFYVEGDQGNSSDQKEFKLRHGDIVPTKPFEVFVDGSLVDRSEYDVYTNDGRVVFKSPIDPDADVLFDYWYTYIGILDAYRREMISPPLIAINPIGDVDRPMELGTTKVLVDATFKLNVYGNSEAQRDDLTDILRKVLSESSVPIWNFNRGFPVDATGKLTLAEGSHYYGGGPKVDDDIKGFDANDIIKYLSFGSLHVVRNPLQSSEHIEMGRSVVTATGEYIGP